jgi:hypothetical protein
MPNSTAHIPPKDRFSLPEVLEHLDPLGCSREDLYEYLRLGHIRTVCYPYRLEPEARADLERKLKDGDKAATGATVYVLRDELLRFIKWLENPSNSRPGSRRKGAGRRPKHDYSDIDACLDSLFNEKGEAGFENLGEVITHLEKKLGENARLHESTLRNHIKTWLKSMMSATRT